MDNIIFNLIPYILLAVAFLIAIEILLVIIIHSLRKNFQWLIVSSKDKLPVFPEKPLEKFLTRSFDSELGWVRRPGEVGSESKRNIGENEGSFTSSSFYISSRGARHNPVYEGLPESIATFGDSFVFCRQVEDSETWQHYLSKLTATNVENYGVGNYGIDQAVLRFKRDLPVCNHDLILLGSVPETLVRIMSLWKHYFEYGNTFAFKPRYIVRGKTANVLRCPVNRKEDFKHINNLLLNINQNDYWYKEKFLKDLLCFPYGISLLCTKRHQVPLIISLLRRRWHALIGGNNLDIANKPWKTILQRNQRYANLMDTNVEALKTLEAILIDFKTYCLDNELKTCYVLFPYLTDLIALEDGKPYYPNMRALIEKHIHLIDLSKGMIENSNFDKYYINDFYGGHLSAAGNEYTAKLIYLELINKGLIDSTDR